ncbi:MAG: hypothetical protein KGQ59_07615 [Bdellovibrionales bacterium]|nr:hypothetical protein [Bdellovibrionales bacterium]
MDDQVSEIFEQLNQICEQYKKEVPGRRHAWPKSIKDRILALQRAGVGAPQIAKRVPVPYATIMSWAIAEKKSGGFLPVKVVKAKRSPTVTVRGARDLGGASRTKTESLTVTVVTPEGFRIEGLPVTEAMSWLRGSRGA